MDSLGDGWPGQKRRRRTRKKMRRKRTCHPVASKQTQGDFPRTKVLASFFCIHRKMSRRIFDCPGGEGLGILGGCLFDRAALCITFFRYVSNNRTFYPSADLIIGLVETRRLKVSEGLRNFPKEPPAILLVNPNTSGLVDAKKEACWRGAQWSKCIHLESYHPSLKKERSLSNKILGTFFKFEYIRWCRMIWTYRFFQHQGVTIFRVEPEASLLDPKSAFRRAAFCAV